MAIPAGVATGGTGNPNAPSTSTDNTVTWNRATHLAFLQQPTDTVYGTSISPAVTVQVLDANGDLVTESSASILLTLAPAGVVLRGVDPVEAVNGIATFPDLTVGQVVGDFTLLAQSPALTDALSTPFRMLPAPLTITANDRSKPYGTAVTFAGTEFTVTGLVPGDSVDSVTLTSLGALASASVAGSPYAIIPSNEVGTGVANYTVTYVPGELTVTAGDRRHRGHRVQRPVRRPAAHRDRHRHRAPWARTSRACSTCRPRPTPRRAATRPTPGRSTTRTATTPTPRARSPTRSPRAA